MWKATIRGLFVRKIRLALTAMAVLLGVSFVAGTYVLTDTLDRSFQGVFDQSVEGIDAVVRLRPPFGGDGDRERFPEALVTQVQDVAGVRSATGFVQGYAQFVGRDGEAIQVGGAPTFGISWAQRGRDGPLRLIDADGQGAKSRPPRAPGEVAMDAGTARRNDFSVGDRVDILTLGPKEQFRIVGLFGFGSAEELGAVTFAAFDLPTAQAAVGAPGLVDAINVTAEAGTDVRDLRERLAAELGGVYEISSGRQVADDRGEQVLDFLALLTQLLLGFAAIGLVVGAFIIFNTFTILVTQRTRELGLLRAMGASRRQVIGSVIGEAAVVGVVASVAGLAAGVGFASLLLELTGRLGFDVPEGDVVLGERTIVVAILVGLVVTVVSAVWPALRASRVPPIAAINDVGTTSERSLRARGVLGVLIGAAGIPFVALGLDRTADATNAVDEIWIVAVGALLVFFGVVVLLATFARPLAAALGAPFRVFGVTGILARENATRNPRRTAATASALVIGLALVGLVSIFGASAKSSVKAAVDRGIRADVVLKAQQFTAFSPQVAERLRGRPELRAVAAFRFGNVRVQTQEETVAGVDATQLGPVTALRVGDGSIGAMGDDGVLVQVDAARKYGLGVGDEIQMQFPQGFQLIRVAGIYEQADFTGGFPVDWIVSWPAYVQGFGADDQDSLVYVKAAGSVGAARAAVQQVVAEDFPNVEVFSRDAYRSDQEAAIDRFLAVTVALLLLSELIAVLGIVNTLALSVFERTREIGLLRAVGMSRRQMRRMIRSESVVVALVGGVVGTALGVFWGWVFTTALESQGVTELSVPVVQLVVFLVLSMLAGVVAAIVPAWRASRLDVLDAIATE
ncbi:MAG TPA: FtsX-like permease family protein [Acidimicrobiia bacterium]|nr:FtsX-like permease family protein [Acidimicrobiia bacterium]